MAFPSASLKPRWYVFSLFFPPPHFTIRTQASLNLSYFTYSPSNPFQAISSISPPNKQIRQKEETWAFDNHSIFSKKKIRKRNRQTYARFCKLYRLTAVGTIFCKNKIFQSCDLENETGDKFPITLVQPYSDFKTLLLKEFFMNLNLLSHFFCLTL